MYAGLGLQCMTFGGRTIQLITTSVCLRPWLHFFQVYSTEVEFLGFYMVILFKIFRGTGTLVCIVTATFYIPANCTQRFQFFCIFTTYYFLFFFVCLLASVFWIVPLLMGVRSILFFLTLVWMKLLSISFSGCSLLVYRNTADFCLLIFVSYGFVEFVS